MKYRIISLLVLAVTIFSGTSVVAQTHEGRSKSSELLVGPNFRLYPSSVTQTEPFIAVHPTNANILFVSANTINLGTGFISEGIYVSTNRGLTWSGSDTCNGAPITFHKGDPGIAIDKNGRFILIRLGFTPGLYSHFSTNNGLTWSGQKTIVTNDQDRGTLTSDVIPSSPYYGRTYAVWVRFAPPYPVFIASTDDGAVNWTSPAQINNPSQRSQGGEVAVGPGGSVNICWASVIPSSPFTEDYVGFASSTNGGASWRVVENAFDMNGIAGIMPEKGNIRVNGLPRIAIDRRGGVRNGWMYVVTTQRTLSPAGNDPDIILNRSTDGGFTWSSGIRVNQDPKNNGKIQFFPAIHVDEMGGVNVLYYDDRQTSSDSASVFLSRSTDGGNTWFDYKVSDHNFKPQAIGGLGQGYQGDNIGIESTGNTLWPVWMDNSSGLYQIWTSPITIPIVDVKEENTEVPSEFALEQNFPNPFNPVTKIRFHIPISAEISLAVFDLLGQEVAVLDRGIKPPGSYEVSWDATGMPSGIYFYRLKMDGRVETRRLAVIR